MIHYLLLSLFIIKGHGKESGQFTHLSAKVLEEEIGIDWWDILNADATCCPGNLDEASCTAEAGSACVWFPKPNNAIAQAAGGVQCVGESFVKCKRRGGITACCTPACNPPGPNAPAPPGDEGPNKTPPVCGPAPVTPAPVTPAPTTPRPTTPRPTTPRPTTPRPTTPRPTTPAPTTPRPTTPAPTTPAPIMPKCMIDVNYEIAGFACQISGDPHTKKVHGGKHDFQGQPTKSNQNGQLLNQFYYVAPCNGYDSSFMPVSIVGTHYHWGTRPVSGIDYLTLELTEDDGSKIYVYASSKLHGYSTNGNSNYDSTKANGAATITSLVSNVPTAIGSTKFEVTYKQKEYKKAEFTIKVNDGTGVIKSIFIYMQGQMNEETALGSTRYRMHYVYIKQDDGYKCAACGLCGSYNGNVESGSLELELCDGTVREVRQGWDGKKTPEAYDLFGLTYEYNFYNDNCVYNYDMQDNFEDLNYEDPCGANIAQAVIDKCQEVKDKNTQCCDKTIGGTVCDDLLEDCKFDACVIATDNGGTTQDIADAVASVMGDTINGVCGIDGVAEALGGGNILVGDYLGCYKDDSNRKFDYPTAGQPLEKPGSIEKCVEICVGKSMKYMGLQYGVECFCGNDLDKITALGTRNPGENQCGMNEQNTDKYNAYGCWGGAWTNCVYDISANLPGNARHARHNDDDILMVNGNYLYNDDSERNNNMIQMGVIGGIVLIGAAGLIYKRYYDKNIKDGKYIPIRDDAKV